MTRSKDHLASVRKLYDAEAGLNYSLDVFGDSLAEREGYTSVDGMEAIHLYLVRKYHWLPRDVRSMTLEDIRFVLTEELADWTLPPEAR